MHIEKSGLRPDGRAVDELRQIRITKGYMENAEGSALIEIGSTRVLCSATIENRVPFFLKDKNRGWVTAEYAMLPRATNTRTARESVIGKIGGRTHEIQRLIGRAMRSVVNLDALGETTIRLDCDVIQADGGTRIASVTGAFVALAEAVKYAVDNAIITEPPVRDYVAGVSVGIVDGVPRLDLSYEEDAGAEVDMNIVMTGSGEFIEIQGTAETNPFDRKLLQKMLDLAEKGIREIISIQKSVLEENG